MLKKKLKPQIGLKSILLIVFAAGLLVADLLTKYFEETDNWHVKIIRGFAEIEGGGVHRNAGCAFSFLNDNPQVGQPILITLTFILLALLIFGFIFLPERFTLLKTAIAIVIAGAIGNLVDRIAFFCVRDWFGLWMFGGMTYCNFADFWIVIGVFLAVFDLMFLNEWAVFPLTKRAKEAQKLRRAEEEAAEAMNLSANAESAESITAPDEEPMNGDGTSLSGGGAFIDGPQEDNPKDNE